MTAEEIVNGVISERRVRADDFFNSRRHVKARLIAIDRLRQSGFSVSDIAVAIQRHPWCIGYWLTDKWAQAEGSVRWSKIAGLGHRDDKSESVAIQVCHDMKIYPAEFFGQGRDARLVKARREAMRRLKAAGFSNAAIARVLKRAYSTVQYWMKDDLREKRLKRCREYTATWRASA